MFSEDLEVKLSSKSFKIKFSKKLVKALAELLFEVLAYKAL